MGTYMLEKNNKDFASGKILPKNYASHILENKYKNPIIKKTIDDSNKMLKKLKKYGYLPK